MLRKYIRLILFLSSFSPLLLIFAVQNPFKSRIIALVLAAISMLSVIMLSRLLKASKTVQPDFVTVKKATSKDGDAMSYIVTYIIPFFGVDFSSPKNWMSLLIMFLILAILYTNSNMMHTNPLLNVVGYHIFEFEDSAGMTLILITKRQQIIVNERLLISHIDGNIYLEGGAT